MVLLAYLLSNPPRRAMDKPTLCQLSGVGHAPRVLANLCKTTKYNGRFIPAIGTPEGKKKAAGGYRVRIIRAEGVFVYRHPSRT